MAYIRKANCRAKYAAFESISIAEMHTKQIIHSLEKLKQKSGFEGVIYTLIRFYTICLL